MKRTRFNRTYTKRLTRNVLLMGLVGGFVPYILSVCDKDPVTELGIAWVTGVVAVCIGYFIRGFKDSKEVADNKYRYDILEREQGNEDIYGSNDGHFASDI